MKLNKIRIGLIFFFLFLIILGINLGEIREIIKKGTQICLSCIGIR
ncbi:MAG: hypothetical protein J7J44_05205 [Deltaproteobacteria bacterium]|nr:hypothetical protein [Deltaproteobacteria bacterium]